MRLIKVTLLTIAVIFSMTLAGCKCTCGPAAKSEKIYKGEQTQPPSSNYPYVGNETPGK